MYWSKVYMFTFGDATSATNELTIHKVNLSHFEISHDHYYILLTK